MRCFQESRRISSRSWFIDVALHYLAAKYVARALLRAVSRLVSTPRPLPVHRPGVETSLDAARRSACATHSSRSLANHQAWKKVTPASALLPDTPPLPYCELA